MSRQDTAWWSEFFPAFTPLFGMLKPSVTRRQVRFIVKKLGLKKGSTFLDCPCGVGRISIPLAEQKIKVTGIDITESYLAELEDKSARKKLEIRLFHSDMRRINFKNEFDGAGNLWTSFGYFEDEADNVRVLKKIYQALKPGGRFVLHLINRDWIIRNYQDRDWMQHGDLKVLESRKMDYATSINRGQWCFIRDGKQQTFDVNIRMYSYHELIGMFKKVGFVDIEGFGDEKENPISFRNQMNYIFGTKPKRT